MFSEMTFIPPFLHCRSLSVALVTLPVSFALSLAFTPIVRAMSPPDEAVYIRAAIGSGLALALCLLAWLNLVRDVGRGYSSSRCSVGAVVLLGASIWPVLVFPFALRQLLVT